MSLWLEKHRNALVEVLYLLDNSTFRDRGRLTDFGDGWIELEKSAAETFLIPTTAVRLLKIIELAGLPDDRRLLRPYEAPPTRDDE